MVNPSLKSGRTPNLTLRRCELDIRFPVHSQHCAVSGTGVGAGASSVVSQAPSVMGRIREWPSSGRLVTSDWGKFALHHGRASRRSCTSSRRLWISSSSSKRRRRTRRNGNTFGLAPAGVNEGASVPNQAGAYRPGLGGQVKHRW